MYLKMNTGRYSQILKCFSQYIQICTCRFADVARNKYIFWVDLETEPFSVAAYGELRT
jgi:hypothetical protein